MPDIARSRDRALERVNPLSPMVARDGCLFCPHQAADHTGEANAVRREGRKYRKYVTHAIFCQGCAPEKATDQAACWQMPERVYRNFTRYGVQVAEF